MAPRKPVIKHEQMVMILEEIGKKPISIDELWNRVDGKYKGEKVTRRLMHEVLQKLLKFRIITRHKGMFSLKTCTSDTGKRRRGRKPLTYTQMNVIPPDCEAKKKKKKKKDPKKDQDGGGKKKKDEKKNTKKDCKKDQDGGEKEKKNEKKNTKDCKKTADKKNMKKPASRGFFKFFGI